MKSTLEIGYSAHPVGSGRKVLIQIVGGNNWRCGLSDRRLVDRWPALADIYDDRGDETHAPGDVAYVQADDDIEVASLLGQHYHWPNTIGLPAAIDKGLLSIAAHVDASCTLPFRGVDPVQLQRLTQSRMVTLP